MTLYTILTSDIEKFTKKINHITKKCDKQGVSYSFKVNEPYDKVITIDNKDKFILNVTDIELDVLFKFNGWKSLGVIQRKDGITQCYLNSQDLIRQYSNTDFHCDHCNKHVHRNSVILLEYENGERKVVGTSCVKEFTCGLDGNLIALYNDIEVVLAQKDSELKILLQGESLDDISIGAFCEQNGSPIYDVERVLSCAVKLIDENGFEPSNSINATWKYILNIYKTTKEIDPEAIKAINWINSLSNDEITKTSYLFNIKQIIDANYCTLRYFGILTSLIPTYRKEEYKKLKEQQESASNYIGKINDKISLEVTYIRSISYDSCFGGGFFHIFTDDNGNVLKWSTTKSLNFKVDDYTYTLDQGAKILLSGTIKEHETFRNVKQTVLTRCKYQIISSSKQTSLIEEYNSYKDKNNQPYDDGVLEEIIGDDWR